MGFEKIIFEKKDGVATITLNNPEVRNSMTQKMADDFSHAVHLLKGDNDVRVVVITGAGKAFCSGADLKSGTFPEGEISPLVKKTSATDFYKKFLAIRELDIPIICSINGPAVGAGCCLTLLGDIRIASEKAKLSMSFVKIGLNPGMAGTHFLPRLVGTSKAYEMMITGDMIDAEEALRIGLVSKVVPHEQLEESTEEYASRLANGAPIAMKLIKKAIFSGTNTTVESAIEYESFAQSLCFESRDFQEGVKAFIEKRPPNFTGM
ncbi:MAG: enoyl-CoA hydratase/isomerase family protein [Thermodesulfobacteriota bacterium]|nr:enoyl-CoA hydratase/isomerase family protein [Thermodesulfobacteriota bacterium]